MRIRVSDWLLACTAGMAAVTAGAAPPEGATLALASNTFLEGGSLGKEQASSKSDCGGSDLSPELHWSDVPDGTKSLALTVFDPQARDGGGVYHWVIWNMPASTRTLLPGAGRPGGAPTGSVVGRNDMGVAAYTGPCPPQGGSPHQYVFTVHALGVDKLQVAPTASPAEVDRALQAVTIESGRIDALYAR